MKPLLLILFLCPLYLVAQTPLLIKGKVRDKTNAAPLAFATVSLHDANKKLLVGTLSDEKGAYELKSTQQLPVFLRIQYVGYQSIDSLIMMDKSNTLLVLDFELSSLTTQLADVVVSAEKEANSVKIDRQTFNVNKLGNTVTGTGLDVLQRLPSVTINTEGQILMRGNAEFLVTINGKFTNQSPADVLAQLPANLIENIEVLSSPSASYDAEGKAGIINIITKKNVINGWFLGTNANLSNINPERHGADLTFQKNTAKWQTFVSVNYRRYDINGYRNGEVRTLFKDTLTRSAWYGERPLMEWIYGIRGGTTYTPNKTLVIATNAYYGYRQNDRIANMHYQEFSLTKPTSLYQNITTSPDRFFYNQNLFSRKAQFFTAATDLVKTFDNKHRLSLTAIYENSVLGGPMRNRDDDETTGKLTFQQRSEERSPLQAWRLQADYLIPLKKNTSLEMGYQWRNVNHKGIFAFEQLNLSSQVWEVSKVFTDELSLNQTIYAGYVQVNGQYQKLQYKAGLRAEQMSRSLTHKLGQSPYELNQLNFFPSVQGLWSISDDKELKLSYSKRIDRPTTKALSPFLNRRHSESIELGDPNLLPEITENVELGYVKRFKNLSLTLTAYHSRVANKVFRINESYNRITLLRIYTNAGNTNSTGVEFTTDCQLTKWWRWYLSGNSYYLNISQIRNAETQTTQSLNFNLNGNMAFKLSSNLRLQWDGMYVSRTVTAQGEDSNLFLSNIGLKYIYSKKLTLDVLCQNIFDSNRQTITTRSNTFYNSTEYIKYDRIIQLSLSYRLNDSGKNTKTLKTEYGEKDF